MGAIRGCKDALNEAGKSVKGSRVLVLKDAYAMLGVAYPANSVRDYAK